jgi:hypothetical protein
VTPDSPIEQLLRTMRAHAVILAEVARAAPAAARAFHPAGLADPSGWVAMGIDELLVHTADVASGLGAPFKLDAELARQVLDRLFPWWPSAEEPTAALLWANGRTSLAGHPSPGAAWLWHCAPLDEWDGTIPRWDPSTSRPAARHAM